MRRALPLAVVVLMGACSQPELVRSPGSVVQTPRIHAGPKAGPERSVPADGSGTGSSPGKPTPKARLPAPTPDSTLPRSPADAARLLTEARIQLGKLVSRWRSHGTAPNDPVTSDIELWALYQQRICRYLAQSPGLADDTLAMLHGPAAAEVNANVTAQRRLYSLLEPVPPPVSLATLKPPPARDLLSFYKEAETHYGVPWEVLAAVNFVETRFGRVRGPSSAGALGPMQFLPSTWDRYGNGGNILDPHDAILGAANYLKASGAPGDIRGALFAYNRADAYGDAVLAYASRMKNDPLAFYKYYFWQVFVRTTKGDVQISGPGAGN